MESTLLQSRHKVLFVPANLWALGIVHGKRLRMHVEELGRTALLLISKEYIQPRTIFEILLRVPGESAPLYALVTASFVERRDDGFGIAARISCISTRSHGRWQRIYDQCAEKRAAIHRATFCLNKFHQKQSVITLGGALPDGVGHSLHYFGVDLQMTWSVDDAIDLAQRCGARLVIGFLNEPQESGHALRRQLAQQSRPPALLLLSDSGALLEVAAQAPSSLTYLVAWPCSQAMLVTRILALLTHLQTSGEADLPAQAESSLASIGEWFEQLVSLWAVHRV